MIQFATAKLLIGDFITFIGTLNQYLIIRITKNNFSSTCLFRKVKHSVGDHFNNWIADAWFDYQIKIRNCDMIWSLGKIFTLFCLKENYMEFVVVNDTHKKVIKPIIQMTPWLISSVNYIVHWNSIEFGLVLLTLERLPKKREVTLSLRFDEQ